MSGHDLSDLSDDQVGALSAGGGIDAVSRFASEAANLADNSGVNILRRAFGTGSSAATTGLAAWATTKRERRIAAREAALKQSEN